MAAPTVVAGGSLTQPATGIAFGPDGSLWHTSPVAVGRTTLLGRTVDLPLPDSKSRGGAIAVGPDLAMWFADTRLNAIMRVTGAGVVEKVRSLSGTPRSLVLGPDGNVWFTQAGKDDDDDDEGRAIGRLTPGGDLTLFDDGLSGSPEDIAAGADGALWFTAPKADRVGRITVDGDIDEFAVVDRPEAIAAGPDGALWFTARKAIGRIDVVGGTTSFTQGLPSSWWPVDIAASFDGTMWFTTKSGIGRVAMDGAIATTPTPGLTPGAISLGGDGALWFTDQQLPVLGRIGVLGAGLIGRAAAAPVLGETFVADVEKGVVKVKKPDGERFKRLSGAKSLPVGTVVDATRGRMSLRSALQRGGTQSGSFSGGRFEVLQPRKRRGLVRLALRGRLDCSAGSSLAEASGKRRKRRRLWGVDLGGLFQTLGLDSVTTVRGTRWLTEDRCNGTFTKVTRGSVVVRERRTGKRVVLRAGESYLAKRRR